MLDMQLVRAPLLARIIGWWMVLLSVSLPIAILVGDLLDEVSGSWGNAVAVSIFALYGAVIGWRTSHMGIVAHDDFLLVRNQIRSYRISKAHVSVVGVRRKLAVWAFGTQLVGYLVIDAGTVIIEASRSLSLPFGRLFSQSGDATRSQMSHVARHIGVELVDPTATVDVGVQPT